jgi:hypothetical protein
MKVKIWTVAADDRLGTRATVHTSEKAAYLQWLEWQFSDELNDEELFDKAAATEFVESGDYHGLWKWREDFAAVDPFDSYVIDEHEIEIGRLEPD